MRTLANGFGRIISFSEGVRHDRRPIAFVRRPCLVACRAAFGAAVNVTSQNRSVHVAIPSIVAEEPAIDETITAPTTTPSTRRSTARSTSSSRSTPRWPARLRRSASSPTSSPRRRRARRATARPGCDGIVSSESQFSITFTLAEERSVHDQRRRELPRHRQRRERFLGDTDRPGRDGPLVHQGGLRSGPRATGRRSTRRSASPARCRRASTRWRPTPASAAAPTQRKSWRAST